MGCIMKGGIVMKTKGLFSFDQFVGFVAHQKNSWKVWSKLTAFSKGLWLHSSHTAQLLTKLMLCSPPMSNQHSSTCFLLFNALYPRLHWHLSASVNTPSNHQPYRSDDGKYWEMPTIPVTILKILAEYTLESWRMATPTTVQYPKRTGLPEENRAAVEGFWHMPSKSASGNDPPEPTPFCSTSSC